MSEEAKVYIQAHVPDDVKIDLKDVRETLHNGSYVILHFGNRMSLFLGDTGFGVAERLRDALSEFLAREAMKDERPAAEAEAGS